MNYYQHHIGDYLTRTAHLTLIEHGAYRRLIDVYYSTESPLPGDVKSVYRLVMARSKEEKEAVDSILSEFFDLEDDGFHQHRCDHEISLCDKNRVNGKKGGRPKKNDNPDETQTKPRINPEDNPDETQHEPNTKAPVTHYPLPVTQSPVNPLSPTASRTPKPEKTETEFQADCRETWLAYAAAYLERYQTKPIRNAKVNSAIKGFVQRIGREEAPLVAAFYVSHNDRGYVQSCHDTGLMLKGAEKLRTEWATNRKVTSITARQTERAGAMVDTVNSILAERAGA